MELDLKFKTLRANLRRHGLVIADDVYTRYHPITIKPKDEICVFCNSSCDITKEHVLPKWLVENELHNTMTSSVNKQMVSYNRATIPACSECNNSVLAYIENYIIKVIQALDQSKLFKEEDACNIIRWLEIIDYKLQVLDCRRKYIKYENSEYDRHWGRFPVSMMGYFVSMSPWRAYNGLRGSQRRIIVKTKIKAINSLVILNTGVRHFNFFTQPNEYIFLSFPMFNVAFFYFIKRRYDYYKDASTEALRIIKEISEL